MEDTERLLEIRSKVKSKKPKYLRQDAHRVKKLENKWRKPKGMHSKMRRRMKSYRKSPEVGYGSPKAVKNLTKEGAIPLIIKSIKELENIGKNVVLILSGKIGLKKKLEIAKKVQKDNLKIKNLDAEKLIKDFEKKIEEKKKVKKVEKEKPKEKKETPKEKSKEKESKEKQIKKKVLENKKG